MRPTSSTSLGARPAPIWMCHPICWRWPPISSLPSHRPSSPEKANVRPAAQNRLAAASVLSIVLRFPDVDLGEISRQLAVIESIPDHELVGDLKAHVVERDVRFGRLDLVQERHDPKRGRPILLDAVDHILDRKTRVHDVLDHDNMAAAEIRIHLLSSRTLPDETFCAPYDDSFQKSTSQSMWTLRMRSARNMNDPFSTPMKMGVLPA